LLIFSFGLVESLNLSQGSVLGFSDEDLDEDHAHDGTRCKEEESSGRSKIVVTDEVKLGSDEIRDPPEQSGTLTSEVDFIKVTPAKYTRVAVQACRYTANPLCQLLALLHV
jgi:hypothetical protein